MWNLFNKCTADLAVRWVEAGDDRRHETGQALVEYALILLFIALAAAAALTALGPQVASWFADVLPGFP